MQRGYECPKDQGSLGNLTLSGVVTLIMDVLVKYVVTFELMIILEKLPSIKVGPTALALPTTLTSDLDLHSPASYGYDLLTRQSLRKTVSQFRR